MLSLTSSRCTPSLHRHRCYFIAGQRRCVSEQPPWVGVPGPSKRAGVESFQGLAPVVEAWTPGHDMGDAVRAGIRSMPVTCPLFARKIDTGVAGMYADLLAAIVP